MKPTVALSTCWCSHRHADGYAMVEEMAGLGFRAIELSHGIRISLLPGILKAVEVGLADISSLHNFCPLPTGITGAAPNLYEPTAPESRERKLWLRHTGRTIDFAQKLGCERVVLHMGSLRFLWRNPKRAITRYRAGKRFEELLADANYHRLIDRTLMKLRKKAVRYLVRFRASLREIVPYAAERGVKLAMENRESIIELPFDHDIASFLNEFKNTGTVYYWHDVGHAQLKERLGVIKHDRLLRENSPNLLGFHLHDVSEEDFDHCPLGSGTIDFSMVRQFFRPEHVLTLELSPNLATEEVLASRDYLLKLLGD